jgi:LAO/AO transport system kinase
MGVEINLESLFSGDRRTLAKAITLAESQLASHQEAAQKMLVRVLPYAGNSIRIGISGIPGVGKSTFLPQHRESLGGSRKKLASRYYCVKPLDMM